MYQFFLICLGGALGAGARFGANTLIGEYGRRWFSTTVLFYVGTLAVNVTGCFLAGFVASLSEPFGHAWLKSEWRDFLIIGFCGGYTTLSSYGLQSLALMKEGEWLHLGVNILASNILGLVAVWIGWVCGKFLHARFGNSSG